MRPIAAEKGIVKVVHPGGYVEILKEPVTASEVLRKNPRHCLTRPDVFKFPWIVIKPESALPRGKVFLLVPNRTLYDLTKSEKHRHPQPQQQQNALPRLENRINYATTAQKKTPSSSSSPSSALSSPPKAFAGMTPKHRARQNPSPIHDVPRNKDDKKPRSSSEKELCGGTPSLSSPPKAFAGMTPKHRARQNPSPIHDVPRNKDDRKPRSSSEKELCGGTPSLSSPAKAFAGMTPKHRARQNPSPIHDVPRNKEDRKPRSSSEKELCGEGQAGTPYWLDRRNSYEEFRRYLASEAESGDVDSKAIDGDILRASTARYRHERRRDNGGNFAEMVLRSCLKKPESDRKSLGLRVSFAVPLTGRDQETESSTNINMRRSKY